MSDTVEITHFPASHNEAMRLVSRLAVKMPWNWQHLLLDQQARQDIGATAGVTMEVFFNAVQVGLFKMPPTDTTRAVSNALGFGPCHGETLGQRRRDYTLRYDVSERTLIRYERRGADQLIALIHPDYPTFAEGFKFPSHPDLYETVTKWVGEGEEPSPPMTDAEKLAHLEARLTAVEKALSELQKSVGKPL